LLVFFFFLGIIFYLLNYLGKNPIGLEAIPPDH